MRNKSDLDTLSMDDLYNNLKVYKSEIKGQSSLNSQNVAFVSFENTSSTNEAVNTAHDVSTTSSQGQASSLTYADDVMLSFFANQSNSPQLDNEDMKHIDTDDLEEMDLKWQVDMLTMRVKRFLKKTGRNLNFNGKETVGFNKTKVECYNCHRRGRFARECRAPRNQWNRNGDAPRRIVPVETPTNSLVVQDGIGGYDWSFQAEEGITNFALMAYTTQGSSSSDSEGRITGQREIRPVWNNAQRVNQQNKFTHPHQVIVGIFIGKGSGKYQGETDVLALLPGDVFMFTTNKSYKTYLAYAMKTASTAKGQRLQTSSKGGGLKPGKKKQPERHSKAIKVPTVLSEVAWLSDEEDDDEVGLNDDDDDNDDDEDNDDDDNDADNQDDDDQEDDGQDDEDQDDVNEQNDSDNVRDKFVHPKLSTQDQKVRHNEEESYEESDEESDEEIKGAECFEEEELDEEETNDEDEANELYRDVCHRLKTLENDFSEFNQTNQFAAAVASIPDIVDTYLANKMNEGVKIADQVKEQVKAQVSKILPKIEKTINEQLKADVLTRSSNKSKTSYVVAANLSELELKKILIDKMESNKRRDDEDKDEEPSAGSNRGSKRRRAGKKTRVNRCTKEKRPPDNWPGLLKGPILITRSAGELLKQRDPKALLRKIWKEPHIWSSKQEDTYPILLSFTHCGNKSILRVLRIILVILPEHPSETMVFHNEDGNPARANIKQALGRLTNLPSIFHRESEVLEGTETGNNGSAWAVPNKDDILEDASEIEQIGVNEVLETANFSKASLQMNVNGMEHEKLSSSSSLTSSSWTDISLKMKEVGPDGEKQSKCWVSLTCFGSLGLGCGVGSSSSSSLSKMIGVSELFG
ncbi:ribonuclease H-like domain-containing protein [Tanacetum coccineum]